MTIRGRGSVKKGEVCWGRGWCRTGRHVHCHKLRAPEHAVALPLRSAVVAGTEERGIGELRGEMADTNNPQPLQQPIAHPGATHYGFATRQARAARCGHSLRDADEKDDGDVRADSRRSADHQRTDGAPKETFNSL